MIPKNYTTWSWGLSIVNFCHLYQNSVSRIFVTLHKQVCAKCTKENNEKTLLTAVAKCTKKLTNNLDFLCKTHNRIFRFVKNAQKNFFFLCILRMDLSCQSAIMVSSNKERNHLKGGKGKELC